MSNAAMTKLKLTGLLGIRSLLISSIQYYGLSIHNKNIPDNSSVFCEQYTIAALCVLKPGTVNHAGARVMPANGNACTATLNQSATFVFCYHHNNAVMPMKHSPENRRRFFVPCRYAKRPKNKVHGRTHL